MSFLVPSTAAVFAFLRDFRDRLGREGIEETDVRLQVTQAGWCLYTGASDYDQDHYGHWGASSLAATDSDETLRHVAHELVEQIVDSVEQNDV